MEKKTIGAFIAVLRKANGLTQRQLAEMLNVSDKAISRWERDEALPDLTMIPVLADIFGVTADELLRGQRNVNDTPPPQAEEKSKKQLQYLLNKAKTDYQIRTLIAVLIAILGVIAAAILNLAFLRAIAGFWVGCIFFLTAAALQTIFYIQTNAKLQNDDFDDAALTACKWQQNALTYWAFAVIIALFAFTLPLVSAYDAYCGLTLRSWLAEQSTLWILAAAGITWFCITQRRSGKLAGPKGKLKLRTALILVAVMAATMLGHGILGEVLQNNRHWTGQATVHESVEDFVEWMQTPLTIDGEPYEYFVVEQDDQGNLIIVYYEDTFTLTDRKETQYCFGIWQNMEVRFIRLNHTVRTFDFGHEEAIYSYTDEQLDAANRIISWIIFPLLIVYPIEIVAAVLIYRRKAQNLPAA